MIAEVSVIIPARDLERYLAAAVASVLSQGAMVKQVLICTARSDSPSAREADRHDERVRAVRSGSGRLGRNLNAGLRCAECDWLAFLDADDAWAEHRLADALRAFARIPELEICFGGQLAMTADGRRGIRPVAGRVLGTTLLRRDTALRIGSFDDDDDVASAMRWLVRAQDLGLRSAMLPDVQLYRRVHADNMTRQNPAGLHAAYLALVRESLDRRRRAQQ